MATLPRTLAELLDREEARARAGLEASALTIASQVERTIDLRGKTRRHPVLMLLGAAVVGAVAAPFLLRAPRRIAALFQSAMRMKGAISGTLAAALSSAYRSAGRPR